jgi:hypothetical protein
MGRKHESYLWQNRILCHIDFELEPVRSLIAAGSSPLS